ncbi:unnamed protein product, partial [Cyprideis torosa]
MRTPTIETLSEAETKKFAVQCADTAKIGDIFLLNGPLGAGKSVFARAFIQHLAGAEINVPSPTFTLVQIYDTAKASLWHFDLYRLEDPDEVYEIGWEEALDDNILLIEWPEHLGHLKPDTYKEIIIEPLTNES